MDIQLQSILEPDLDICGEKALYFHKNGREICYDGYFNLFYMEKWKRYTNLKQLQLVLTLKGFEKLRLYHNRNCISKQTLAADAMRQYSFPFPWDQYHDGVFWFSLVQSGDGAACHVSGFYAGMCEHERHVALGIDICTYQREAYVLRSLKVLCEKILSNDNLQVAGSLQVYIADNGRTLDGYEPIQPYLQAWKDRVSVIPNRNAGGAGGFTRGMLEVLKEKDKKSLTHIVLMDDDAMPNPDLFVRMYGFLRVVRDEWKDITLGGTMLDEALPYMLYASGEEWCKGLILNPNKNIDLRKYENACSERLLTTRFEKQHYSGWWCCCYSLNVVRENNLPIPLFIHHDDIEFGLRNQRYGAVFLNGVNVWHKNFDGLVTGSNLYYDIRNDLIEITQQYGRKDAAGYIWKFYWKRLAVRIARNKPDEVSYVIRGAEDFLKGPRWLWEQDPERLHAAVRNIKQKKLPGLLFSGVKICWRLLTQRRKAVRDYQENMKKYTTRQAWEKYLGL